MATSCAQGGDEYVAKVFAYVEREDTPRSVTFQLELLRQYGFDRVEVLHKRGFLRRLWRHQAVTCTIATRDLGRDQGMPQQ